MVVDSSSASQSIRLIDNKLWHQLCPLCNSSRIYSTGTIPYPENVLYSSTLIKLKNKAELWRCRECRSGFVQNAIPQNVALKLYSEGNSGERWSNLPIEENKLPEVIDQLSLVFRIGFKVLDIGCNTGELLDYAKSKGCNTTGVEFSQKSREIISLKGHVQLSSLNEVNMVFDVITAFDLLEHLYAPSSFFNFCYDRLRSNGILIILTGNISSLSALITKSNWWYIRYPEHIIFPSRKYYEIYSGFKIKQFIHTYASKGYKNPLLTIIKYSISDLIYRRYTGLPSMGPDHVLVVLQK